MEREVYGNFPSIPFIISVCVKFNVVNFKDKRKKTKLKQSDEKLFRQ